MLSQTLQITTVILRNIIKNLGFGIPEHVQLIFFFSPVGSPEGLLVPQPYVSRTLHPLYQGAQGLCSAASVTREGMLIQLCVEN